MKVYYVWTDFWDWDDYDAFVVVAENENKALELVKDKFRDYQQDKISIEEVDMTTENVILGSFNAG